MTVTINPEHVYVGIILLLMLIQVYQQRTIKKLERDCESLWQQMGTLLTTLTSQMMSLQKDINNKQDKETK